MNFYALGSISITKSQFLSQHFFNFDMVEEDFDLIIKWTDPNKTLRLRLTDKTLTEQGQHGKSSLFEDNQGQLWLMKVFTNAIDEDSKEIQLIDVD